MRTMLIQGLCLLLLCTAQAALAQPKISQKEARAVIAAQEAVDQGLRKLPVKDRAIAYVRHDQLPCTVANAVDRPDVVDQVEVSCTEGRGYLFTIIAGLPAVADCLTTETGEFRCSLPENRRPQDELKPFLSQAGLACEPKKARWAGLLREHAATMFEVSCSEGGDYILSVPDFMLTGSVMQPRVDESATWLDCLMGPHLCKFTNHPAQVARFNSAIVPQISPSCTVDDARYVGILPSQELDIYEVSCKAAASLLIETTKTQHLVRTLACSDATAIGTQCKLHDGG